MPQTLNHDDSITIIAYSLPEFVFEVASLAMKGFTPSMENNHCPSGGFGSYYTCTVVPIHHHYIGIDGKHYNTPETSTETPLKAPTSDVISTKATPVATETKTARTAAKKTT